MLRTHGVGSHETESRQQGRGKTASFQTVKFIHLFHMEFSNSARSCLVKSQYVILIKSIDEILVSDLMNRRDLLKLSGMGVAVFVRNHSSRRRIITEKD